MFVEDHRRYFIMQQYWDLWGIVEEEDAYICHDVLEEYAQEWHTTVEELLKQKFYLHHYFQ